MKEIKEKEKRVRVVDNNEAFLPSLMLARCGHNRRSIPHQTNIPPCLIPPPHSSNPMSVLTTTVHITTQPSPRPVNNQCMMCTSYISYLSCIVHEQQCIFFFFFVLQHTLWSPFHSFLLCCSSNDKALSLFFSQVLLLLLLCVVYYFYLFVCIFIN